MRRSMWKRIFCRLLVGAGILVLINTLLYQVLPVWYEEYGINRGKNNDGEMSLYTERRLRLQKLCEDRQTSGKTENILVYRNMSYCVVPKAGCTFWIRVFRFLHNDTMGRHLENPFQMLRSEVHDGRHRHLKLYRLEKDEDRDLVMKTVRFMVARNPFSRLFSGYMDKLYLPSMWESAGREIASRRQNKSMLCGHDVSFSEFLAHVASVGEIEPRTLNGHWRPIDKTCDPCTFLPDLIAKQESFSADSRYILQHFGLGHLLEGHSQTDHVIDEIRIITESNYQLGSGCMKRKELARRLWRTFQVNGYLRPGSELILDPETDESLSLQRLQNLMIAVHKSRPLSREESRSQRGTYLRVAYSKVPTPVLNKIKRLYKNDFDFFGYTTSLSDVYA